ncbi:hypothetical protein K440DRAFT_248012 [Wilcoxina mikolae CBS 423.85]|nr:hypothetical protein K440DRAFT_248012 [Wilcoxina mikolae CBS 423.85]
MKLKNQSQPIATSPSSSASSTAFQTAASKLHAIHSGDHVPPPAPLPKRLANIYTGVLESFTLPKPFIIASYVWTPERLPPTPTYGWVRRKAPWDLDPAENQKPSSQSMESWVTQSPYFDEWAELLSTRYPDVAQICSEELNSRFICPPNRPAGIVPEYLEEVFHLVAREAHLRGISHVWLDSICVDQSDPEDIADQVPKMRDYYSQATCCVVVAETIRRRLSPDSAPMVTQAQAGAYSLVGRNLDSTENLLGSWVVGFHDERVWTLQETLLSREVVGRAGDIRIHVSLLLEPETLQKYEMGGFEAVINALPLSRPLSAIGTPITPQYCLRLLRYRNATKFHDQIYGILGLFPEAIRYSMPVDYSLSLGTIAAIFGYLRVANGDLSALLTLWNPQFDRCSPGVGLSWVQGGFGYPETEIKNFVAHKDLDMCIDGNRGLSMTMSYIKVSEISSCREWLAMHEGMTLADLMDYPNVAVTLVGSDGVVFPLVYAGTIEPSGEEDAGGAEKERDGIRECLEVAAREGRVVFATIGRDLRTLDGGGNEDMWTWLLLVTEDEGTTWCRRGVVFTDELNLERGGRRRFCIG